VVFSCCWASPAESFSCLSPGGLISIFYCLNIDTPPIWRARFLTFLQLSCLYHLGTDRVGNAFLLLRSLLLGFPRDRYSFNAQQLLLFTEPLLSNSCCKKELQDCRNKLELHVLHLIQNGGVHTWTQERLSRLKAYCGLT
jgi:hypothetical protein